MRYHQILIEKADLQLASAVKKLIKVYGNNIPFSVVNLSKSEYEYIDLVKWHINKPPKNSRIEKIQSSCIIYQEQNGVSGQNLLEIINSQRPIPLPELLFLKEDLYWIIEGHHRIFIELLKGNTFIEAEVKYT